MNTAILIPTDPRTGKPLVTSAMKAACIAEFTMDVEETCPDCSHPDREPDICCDICGGEVTFTTQREIPWDTMKGIYKMMAAAAAAEITPGITPPSMVYGFEPAHGGDRAALALVHRDQMATFIIDPSGEQPEPRKITFNGNIEYCAVCPAPTLLELEETDGFQRLKCPTCGFTREL